MNENIWVISFDPLALKYYLSLHSYGYSMQIEISKSFYDILSTMIELTEIKERLKNE